MLVSEAIDILLAIKEKLTKEEMRHLDDARREKQVKDHVVQQAQELPPVCSSSCPRKPSRGEGKFLPLLLVRPSRGWSFPPFPLG